jgi:hypothetical protein
MTEADIERTIEDFVRCGELAREVGYDGVEIMGSEGYLLTQFVTRRANQRTDRWGGAFGNRCRIRWRSSAGCGPGWDRISSSCTGSRPSTSWKMV